MTMDIQIFKCNDLVALHLSGESFPCLLYLHWKNETNFLEFSSSITILSANFRDFSVQLLRVFVLRDFIKIEEHCKLSRFFRGSSTELTARFLDFTVQRLCVIVFLKFHCVKSLILV